MVKRRIAGFFVCAAILLGCGGGGGGSSGPPLPTPPSATAFGGTRLTLASMDIACEPTCYRMADVHIDANGDIGMFWTEETTVGTGSLKAAHVSAAATALTSVGTLDSFALALPLSRSFVARHLSGSRFILFDRDFGVAPPPGAQTGGRVRTVDFASATPVLGTPVTVPLLFSDLLRGMPVSVLDANRTPHVFELFSNTPSTLDLGNGATLNVVPAPEAGYSSIDTSTISDFEQSIARALWLVSGEHPIATGRRIYLSQLSLPDGQVLPSQQVSNGPIVQSNSTMGCHDVGGVKAQATGVTTFLVGWREVNMAGNGCDLVINGQRINATGTSVANWAASGRDGEMVVVWEQHAGFDFSNRVMWSRFNPNTLQWSAPADLEPTLLGVGDMNLLVAASAGPAGTLAVVWQRNAVQNNTATPREAWLMSKFVNGAWTTVAATGGPETPVALAINAAGRVAATFTGSVCGTGCQKHLVAYRH